MPITIKIQVFNTVPVQCGSMTLHSAKDLKMTYFETYKTDNVKRAFSYAKRFFKRLECKNNESVSYVVEEVDKYEAAVNKAATSYQNYYLDFVNNFITVGGYASFYDISESKANARIEIGRKIHASKTEGESK